MPDEPTPDESKLHVDEDWKTQVQAEKNAAEQQRDAPAGEGSVPDESGAEPGVPAASFDFLVTTLATQAMMALAQAHDKDAEISPATSIAIAQHHIDTLGILQEKTKGNLTGDEMVQLNNVLHELRTTFVSASKFE